MREAHEARVLRLIREVPDGLTGSQLSLKTAQWLSLPRRRRIIRSLTESGLVSVRVIAGRTKSTTVYIATESRISNTSREMSFPSFDVESAILTPFSLV